MACRDCENREISKRQDPEGWRDMEMGPVECEKHRSAKMTSEDVPTTRCEGCGQPVAPIFYYHHLAECVVQLAEQVRELRKDQARMDWLEANGPEAIAGSGEELLWLIEWWEGNSLMQTEADYLRDAIDLAIDGDEVK